MTVESSGSIPAPRRRRKIPGLMSFARKREWTAAEAREEILRRLDTRRAHWHGTLRQKLPERYVEDTFGQVCVKITEYVGRVDARTIKDFDGYIATACRNAAVDCLRSAASEAKALVRLAALPETVVDHDEVVATERQVILLRFLTEVLTERQRVVYVLTHVNDFAGKDVAKALGISHDLVRKELSVAQKAVEAALDDEEVRQRLQGLLDGR
ncbi:RNA polymerase sigma factor [Streptomyces sp. NPDC057238]|uniref:RNA polymerase sigma factor n=1 Tax=Streptomyces sp. NPDC057238 TaxID=3346060 RepID=UPI0036367563